MMLNKKIYIVVLDEAAIAENRLPHNHSIIQLQYNLKPSIRGFI